MMLLSVWLAALTTSTPQVAVMPPAMLAEDGDGSIAGAAIYAGLEDGVGTQSSSSSSSSSSWSSSPGVSRLSRQNVQALIEKAAKDGLQCDASSADCAARIGAFGGVDFVIVARVDVAAARASVALLDCATGRAVREVEAGIGRSDAAAHDGAAALAVAVLNDGKVAGEMRITGPVGAEVIVDGKNLGPLTVDSTGQGALSLSVLAGAHRLGKDGAVLVVDVPAGSAVSVALAGDNASPSPLLLRAGVGAIALGSLVLFSGLTGAAVTAPDADERERYSAKGYNDAVFGGRALLGVAAVGVVVVGVGVFCVFAGSP